MRLAHRLLCSKYHAKKIAARRVYRKSLRSKALRQLFTIQAAIHPITNEIERTIASPVRIFTSLLEKQDHKQTKHK